MEYKGANLARHHGVYGAIFTCLLVSHAGYADTTNTQQQGNSNADSSTASLDRVVVTAKRSSRLMSEDYPSYAAQGATLLKDQQPLKEIPQSVSVMTHQRMEDQHLDSVQSVLDQTPGIYSSSSSYLGTSDSAQQFYSRGFEITDYMVDGMETDESQGYGKFSFAGPTGSSAIYDRVEVLRGVNGLLQGNGKPGGAVNLVRKRPTRDFHQHYSLSGGSWRDYQGMADVSGSLDKEGYVRGRFVANYDTSHRFYDKTHSKSPTLYGVLEFDPNDKTRISIGATDENYHEWAPKQDDFTGLGYTPKRRKHYSPSWGYKKTHTDQVFADFSYQFDPNWSIMTQANFSKQKTTDLLPRVNESSAILQALKLRTRSFSLGETLNGNFEAMGQNQHLTLSANHYAQRQRVMNKNVNLTSSDAYGTTITFPDNYDDLDGDEIWPYDSNMKSVASSLFDNPYYTTKTTTNNIVGKLDWHWTSKFSTVIGGRVSWYNYDYYNTDGSYNSGSSGTVNHKFTPYLGLVYDITPEWTAYASYAKLFDPQWGDYALSGKQIPNATGTNREIGLKGELYNGALNLLLSAYKVDLSHSAEEMNSPYDDDCPSSPTGGACYYDTNKKIQGIDFEANGQILPGWQLGGGYTYTDTKVQWPGAADSNFNGFTITPRHMIKLFSSYDVTSKLTLGGGVNFQTKELSIGNSSDGHGSGSNDTQVQHAYSLWNAFGRYRFTPHIAGQINVDNLFDKKYWPNRAATSKWMYGEPRSITVSLKADY